MHGHPRAHLTRPTRLASRGTAGQWEAARAIVYALAVLALVGVVTGELLGHLLAAGIETLLDAVASDRSG